MPGLADRRATRVSTAKTAGRSKRSAGPDLNFDDLVCASIHILVFRTDDKRQVARDRPAVSSTLPKFPVAVAEFGEVTSESDASRSRE